ncbi:unnamed protein product [Lactuca virosa]|uniref:Centromere protein C n=1 Tax=Lactuca virosa TaxID=75947 RepID=A0AAU9P8F4_9ASTR|nr:unnamed protein product [Lactuca virosa]
MNQTQSFTLVDPFEEQSIISLNPRTLRLSKDALKSKDLEAVHQYTISMALQSPDKYFEEAKSVVDGGLEFLNTKKTEADIKEKENPQKHRPGLVRKRAKFSLKPDTSQSSTLVEPSLEIDQLQDPEEFFAAFEKFEITSSFSNLDTQKELKRQRGGGDVDEVKTSTTVRHRRPEIPRRKVSYKHYEYYSQSQEYTSVAQETLQDKIVSPIPPTRCLQQESFTPNQQCDEEEVTESISKSENRIHKMFDELMASNIENLDGNEALSFLKERMNIKDVDIEDLQLPEFHEIPRVDFISPFKNLLQESQNKSILTTDTTEKVLLPNKYNPPFQSVDPFSSTHGHDVDSHPTTFTKIISASKDMVSATSAKKNITETATATGDMEDREHNVEERDAGDIRTNEDINGNSEDTVAKAASVVKEFSLDVEEIISEENNNVEDVTEKAGEAEVNVVEDLDLDLRQPDADDVNIEEDMDMDTSGQSLDIVPVPEQQNEEEEHRRINKKTNKRKKNKIDPKKRRQSLAGAGSSWTSSGVRRSSRIKRRPLEYWKGERLLYARVHNSLPTVIGVKYISPSKGDGFKVESFVSHKYKHLVELTALH